MLEEFVGMDIGVCLLRLFLALLCGGVLGIERGRKKRPAGFRTYMLVCLGAALVMMTNEYICRIYGTGDPARMGAQVVSGIGFLGAGTIIVTGHNRVKGLTTAAGLWAAACIGLAIGVGFYGGGIIGTFMIFVAMSSLNSVDGRVSASSKVMNLYIELAEMTDIRRLIQYLKENGMKLIDIEMDNSNKVNDESAAILISLQLINKKDHDSILYAIRGLEGVKYIEEI